MIKKTIKLITILLVLIVVTVKNEVIASTVGWARTGIGNISFSSEPPEDEVESIMSDAGGEYKCTYNYSFEPTTTIYINAYNLEGTSIIPNSIKSSAKIKAGTWVGINITEEKFAPWAVDKTSFKYKEVLQGYECQYKKWKKGYEDKLGDLIGSGYETYIHMGYDCTSLCQSSSNLNIRKNTEYGKEITGGCGCYKWVDGQWEDAPSYTIFISKSKKMSASECPRTDNSYKSYKKVDETKTVSITDIPQEVKTECEEEATAATYLQALGYVDSPTSEIKYLNANVYETTNEPESLTATLVKDGYDLSYPDTEEERNKLKSGTEERHYEYMPERTCINVKNSEVRYITDKNEYCTTDEMTLSTEEVYDPYLGKSVTYWRYFVPLNVKTGTDFYLKLIKGENTNGSLTENECYNVINNYSSKNNYYVDYIAPDMEGNNFTGNTTTDRRTIDTNDGCYFATKVNFNIVQEFYNEEKDDNGNLKFNGFNFYYRPVDITNPFPNTISTNSYWKGYWKDETKANFNNSFDKITYETELNLREVRETTADIADESIQEDEETGILISGGSYSDWINTMNKDGSSKLISKKTSIIKDPETTYYPLGCGPSNKNWIQCKKSGGNS